MLIANRSSLKPLQQLTLARSSSLFAMTLAGRGSSSVTTTESADRHKQSHLKSVVHHKFFEDDFR